jgi:hypothetical protein
MAAANRREHPYGLEIIRLLAERTYVIQLAAIHHAYGCWRSDRATAIVIFSLRYT